MNHLLEEINQELSDIIGVDIETIREIKECSPETICIYGGDEDLHDENEIVSLYKDYKYLNFAGYLKTLMFTSVTRRPANTNPQSGKRLGVEVLDDRLDPVVPSRSTTRAQSRCALRQVQVVIDDQDPFRFDFVKAGYGADGLAAQIDIGLWFDKYDPLPGNLAEGQFRLSLFLVKGESIFGS